MGRDADLTAGPNNHSNHETARPRGQWNKSGWLDEQSTCVIASWTSTEEHWRGILIASSLLQRSQAKTSALRTSSQVLSPSSSHHRQVSVPWLVPPPPNYCHKGVVRYSHPAIIRNRC